MSNRPFEKEAAAAWSWWSQLQPRDRGGRLIPGDRATLAKLRRSATVIEAATEPVTAILYQRLAFAHAERDLPRAAMLAAVLAHAREDARDPLARAIGTPRAGEGSAALVSPLRLRRLMAAREPDDLLIVFRRVVAILGNTVNVRDLAHQLIAWTDVRFGDISRTQFAFAYHNAAQFAPEADSSDIDED
ncbi:MAG TPA: type I-E CRISPR-associated protein Cse2/CasB [Hyphomicrobiaceae bacterium]|nr:type I-E CRISPR-associated protein Cse2/CasB [Hyphomicrobiaceae bacterium]